MTTSMRNVVTATSAATMLALFSGCAAGSPPATTTSSSSTTPTATDTRDPASAAVSDYLEAIAFGNPAGAWRLLSAETQATFDSSVDTYAEYTPYNESVTHDDAEVLAAAPFIVTAGPQDGVQIVSAQSGGIADAWVVRETPSGMRIDDPGIAPTGERPFTWRNPDDMGNYDDTAKPMIFFQTFYGSGGETDVIAGPPESIFGYADGVEVPVTKEASSGAGSNFVADVPAGAATLTVVWAPDSESSLWQSSTVSLD